MLARVTVSEEIALSFFLSGLTVRLEKSFHLQRPSTFQEAMQLARLQEDVLQELTKEIHGISMRSSEEHHRNFKTENQVLFQEKRLVNVFLRGCANFVVKNGIRTIEINVRFGAN